MFVSLHIPDFPVVAALRANPAAKNQPCAVLAVQGSAEAQEKLPLLAINPLARTAGIQAGWPLNRALIRCPDLRVIPRDPAAEAGLRAGLVGLGESLGPDLEVTASDAVTIDLATRRQPPGDDWAELELAELADTELWHARAATPDLAHLAARHEATQGRTIGPADLASLPLEILGSLATGKGPMAVLELWGIRRLGDFMALPRQALAERLGTEAGHWHDMLHGKTCRLLRLHRPPESFAQSFDCDDSITSLDPLIFALKRMLHALAGRLASRHLAASLLDCRLDLESGDALERRVSLPEPQSQVEGMLSPLQMWLESLRLAAPVVCLHLDAETTFAASAQREWFGRQMPQPERFAETLAKLDALLGTGRVGIPSHGQSYDVDCFRMLPAIGGLRPISSATARAECPLPLRRFRPPRRIAVAHEMRDRKPWPLALLNGPHPGEIIDRRGPFPASGDWWRPVESWQRLEWDIQLASRHLLRLVFLTPDAWQLDGIYQ
jgi:protein ImuB